MPILSKDYHSGAWGTHWKHVSIQPGWLLVLSPIYIYQSAGHKVEASWWPLCQMFSNLDMVFMVSVSITGHLLITQHLAESHARTGHCGPVLCYSMPTQQTAKENSHTARSTKQIPMEKWDCPEAPTLVLQATRGKIYVQLDICSGKDFWRASFKMKTHRLALPGLIGICPVSEGLETIAITLVVNNSGWLLGGILEITHIVPSWVASSLPTLIFLIFGRRTEKICEMGVSNACWLETYY